MSLAGPSVERLLGGRLGRRAQPGGIWYTAGPWAMLALTISWLVLMVRQQPCLAGLPAYSFGCYTDIVPLFYSRGFSEGLTPYVDADLEYPVLIGMLLHLLRLVTNVLGGETGPDLPREVIDASADLFFSVNAVVLFLAFVLLVWAHLKLSRPWDALMIALSPAIMTAGLINWDAIVVALTSVSLLAWSRRRLGWTGFWLGLAIAAKLYPVLVLIPLAVLCLRAGRWKAFFTTAGMTAATWLAANLPVYLAAPQGWLNFWTFNVDRGPDLGSLWYALSLAGVSVPPLSALVAAILVVGALALGGLLLFAPRRPRLAQGVFLLVALFLIVNKVYSPQYVLWLLPLLVLARPKWREWAIFTVAELLYFFAIWGHLGGTLASGYGGQDRLYIIAVLLRVAVQLWLCVQVVRDILTPSRDPVRADGLDDPDGGELDGRPDAPWLVRLRARI